MSLWGATVITSLASALPIVGGHIVAWLWGGFAKPLNRWRLNFACCGNSLMNKDYLSLENPKLFYSEFYYMIEKVKILFIHSQSADVWVETYRVFSTRISPAPASQRLNAKEHAWFVGFIEADGWFGVFRNGKYIQYEIGIELHKKDIALLYQIQNKYKLSGIVRERKDRPGIIVLKVRNKKDLYYKIVPIFDQFPILGPKFEQYLRFRYYLVDKKAVYWKELFFKPLRFPWVGKNFDEMLQVSYFDAWLVGFINGEACFSVYQIAGEKNSTCSFDISQKLGGDLLLIPIKKRLKLKANVFYDPKTECFKLKTTSISGCQNIVIFLFENPTKLQGYKYIQFLLWVKQIRVNPRYAKVRIPFKLSFIFSKPTIFSNNSYLC